MICDDEFGRVKGFFMSYTYSAQLTELSVNGFQCPPSGSVLIQRDAWRWVANPVSTQCFAPVGIRNPPRLLKATDPAEKCSCWGLSMHCSYEQSVSAFQGVQKSFPKARKIFGGYVASVSITPTDGACTLVDRYGHFDLHPFVTGSLQSRISSLSAIP